MSGQTNGQTKEDSFGVGWQNYLLYKSVIITTLPLVPGLLKQFKNYSRLGWREEGSQEGTGVKTDKPKCK